MNSIAPEVHPEIWPAIAPTVPADPEMELRITELLGRMSVEDKVGQVIQGEIRSLTPEDVREYRLGSVLNGGGVQPGGVHRARPEQWLELADAFWEASMDTSDGGLAIPCIWGTDAVHGHTNVIGATIFPHNIGLGATRNPELVRRIGEITATEMLVTGLDWTFAPTLAVVRNDRWGRTYEGYSEDPEIVAEYAGEMVRGIQGAVGSEGFLGDRRAVACAKHFLGDGGTTDGVDQGDNRSTEAELRDIHGAGYFSALDAGVQTVMASFSSWQGTKMHGNRGLLTNVLKDGMGFDGFVVGDWNGHGQVPGCSNRSCPTAFNAGVDMFMVPKVWKALYKNTVKQVGRGEISLARLDDAVRRILRVKMRAGLFERGKPSSRTLAGRWELLGSKEHRAVARQAVRESLVLLKNDGGLLPLDRSQRVLVAGDAADDIGRACGGWTVTWQGTETSNEDFPGGTSIWDGIRSAVEGSGGVAELSVDGSFDTRPDAAVVVFGEEPYAEGPGDRDHLEYSAQRPGDLEILRSLQQAGVPVVSVFISGRPMWVNPELNASTAFVAAWLPGAEGAGVADVLFRATDGSIAHDFTGRLSFSWPRTAAPIPVNRGVEGGDPLFVYGYGLDFSSGGDPLEVVDEAGSDGPSRHRTVYFDGAPVAPWRLEADEGIAVRSVDRRIQEDAREVSWERSAVLALRRGGPLDLRDEVAGGQALAVDLRLDEAPKAPLWVGVECGPGCQGRVDVSAEAAAAAVGQWRTLTVPLAVLAEAGADMSRISAPFVLAGYGGLRLRFAEVRLVESSGETVQCR